MSGVGAVGGAGVGASGMGAAGVSGMSGIGGGINSGAGFGGSNNAVQGIGQDGVSKLTKSAQDNGIGALAAQNPNASNIQNNSISNMKGVNGADEVGGVSNSQNGQKLSHSFDRVETKCEVNIEKESTTWSLKTEGGSKAVALHMHCPHSVHLKEKEMLAKLLLAALLLMKLLELLDKKENLPLFLVFGGDKDCGIVPVAALQEKSSVVSNISVEKSSFSVESVIQSESFSSEIEQISSDSALMSNVNIVDSTHRGMARDICASMVRGVEMTGQTPNLSAFHSGQPTGMSIGIAPVGGASIGGGAGGGAGMGGAVGGGAGGAGGAA